ncbi:MAG: hypothetical protein ABI639_02495 [Thermoanaerobaculia bacterium]
MLRIRHSNRIARKCAVALAALLFTACTSNAPARTAATVEGATSAADRGKSDGPADGTLVVAVVARLELSAHEEWIEGPGGGVIVENLVWLWIVAPEPLPEMVAAHVVGHPQIAGRPLLLGSRISFLLPHDWKFGDLAFQNLEELRFVDAAP